jgi:hypothetical protein
MTTNSSVFLPHWTCTLLVFSLIETVGDDVSRKPGGEPGFLFEETSMDSGQPV